MLTLSEDIALKATINSIIFFLQRKPKSGKYQIKSLSLKIISFLKHFLELKDFFYEMLYTMIERLKNIQI